MKSGELNTVITGGISWNEFRVEDLDILVPESVGDGKMFDSGLYTNVVHNGRYGVVTSPDSHFLTVTKIGGKWYATGSMSFEVGFFMIKAMMRTWFEDADDNFPRDRSKDSMVLFGLEGEKALLYKRGDLPDTGGQNVVPQWVLQLIENKFRKLNTEWRA